jgi:hypothetical protein
VEPTGRFELPTRCLQIRKQLFAYVRQRPLRTQVRRANGPDVRLWPPVTAPDGVKNGVSHVLSHAGCCPSGVTIVELPLCRPAMATYDLSDEIGTLSAEANSPKKLWALP